MQMSYMQLGFVSVGAEEEGLVFLGLCEMSDLVGDLV